MEFLKQIIIWAWNNKERALIILLLLIVGVQTKRYYSSQQDLEKQLIERGKLPDDIDFIGEIKGTKLTLTYRDSKNNVVFKEYYVPREGGAKFTKHIDLKKYDAKDGFGGNSVDNAAAIKMPSLNPLKNLINIITGHNEVKTGTGVTPDIRYMGFTFRPGIFGVYDGGFNSSRPFNVGIDAKLFFLYRWSAGLGTTVDYPEVFISRHVDDFVPFIPVENLELMLGYGKPYSNFGNSVLLLGGRTNF
jgi:hypothetical protein